MKKLMSIIFLWIAVSIFSANAEKVPTKADVHDTNTTLRDNRPRMPLVKPVVEVIYDIDAHSLEVACSYFCDVTVCVYDELGCVIAVADSMDEVIMLPTTCSGNIHVVIESANWYATANVHI